MVFKFTSLPSFTPRCSSATISVMARTRACMSQKDFLLRAAAGAECVYMQETGAHLLWRQQRRPLPIDALLALVGGRNLIFEVSSHISVSITCSAYQNCSVGCPSPELANAHCGRTELCTSTQTSKYVFLWMHAAVSGRAREGIPVRSRKMGSGQYGLARAGSRSPRLLLCDSSPSLL